MSKKRFITGLAIGVTAGVLFAPKKGSETRAEIKEKITLLLDMLKEEMKKIDDFDEIDFNLEDKIANIKNELASLDKEKIKSIAKAHAEKIKEDAEEIYEIAKEKGTEVMQKTANEIRIKSVDLLHNIADSLENTKAK